MDVLGRRVPQDRLAALMLEAGSGQPGQSDPAKLPMAWTAVHRARTLSACFRSADGSLGCRRRVTSTSRQRNLAISIRLSDLVGGSRFRLRRGAHLALGPRIPGAMSLSLTRSPWCGCGPTTTGRRRVKTLLQLPVLRFWPATSPHLNRGTGKSSEEQRAWR